MFPSETFLKPGLVDRKMWTSYQGLRVDVCLVTLIIKWEKPRESSSVSQNWLSSHVDLESTIPRDIL